MLCEILSLASRIPLTRCHKNHDGKFTFHNDMFYLFFFFLNHFSPFFLYQTLVFTLNLNFDLKTRQQISTSSQRCFASFFLGTWIVFSNITWKWRRKKKRVCCIICKNVLTKLMPFFSSFFFFLKIKEILFMIPFFFSPFWLFTTENHVKITDQEIIIIKCGFNIKKREKKRRKYIKLNIKTWWEKKATNICDKGSKISSN